MLLLFAVVVCVLGLGQSMAPSMSMSGAPEAVVSAGAVHAGHDLSAAAPQMDPAAPMDVSADSTPGHGAHGDHSMSCTANLEVAPPAATIAPDATESLSAVVAQTSNLRTVAVNAVLVRPPDLSTLCVQRT